MDVDVAKLALRLSLFYGGFYCELCNIVVV